jgi:hypothetical protein
MNALAVHSNLDEIDAALSNRHRAVSATETSR